MLSLKEFVKIFKKSGVAKDESEQLYWSMIRSCILISMGKRQSQRARQKEDIFQQSIIKSINFSKVSTRGKFLEKIFDRERDIREDAKMKKYPPHVIENFVIEGRLSTFVPFLQIRLEDAELLEEVEKRLEVTRNSQKNHKFWKIGIGVMGGILALKVFVDLLSKNKNNKEGEK